MRFFLIGFMGSGKSHWGKLIAGECGMPFIDLDEAIAAKTKMSVTEIFEQKGEEYFRSRERELLEEIISEKNSVVLACGGGTPCFFNNIDLMKASGTVIWLNTSIDVLFERLIEGRKQRPVLKNIPDEELKEVIVRKLNERRIYYDQADIVIDNEREISTANFIQTILHA